MKKVFSRKKLLAEIEKEVENMDTDLLSKLYAYISGMESCKDNKSAEEEK